MLEIFLTFSQDFAVFEDHFLMKKLLSYEKSMLLARSHLFTLESPRSEPIFKNTSVKWLCTFSLLYFIYILWFTDWGEGVEVFLKNHQRLIFVSNDVLLWVLLLLDR